MIRFLGSMALIVCFSLAWLDLSCPSAWAAGCNAQNVGSVVGRPYSDKLAEMARVDANAAIVRKLEVGQPYTMEFSDDRMNLVVDRKGIVVKVYCG